MRKLWFIGILLALLLATPVIMAQDATPEASPAVTPKMGGTLKAAWDAEWVSLDPHLSSAYSSFAVLANVVEGLTTFDNNIKLEPDLAESWEQSADGLTWTFHIRQGVKFSNGRVMDSSDVLYSFQRIMDPKLGSGRVNSCGGADAKFAAPDANTFTITTGKPDGILPITIATAAGCGIVAKESVGADGQIVVPIGTGPFTIQDVQGTTSMKLMKNPTYWQTGFPYLDEVDINVIPEGASRVAALLGGEDDWILAPPSESYNDLKSNQDVVLSESPQLGYDYMALNTKHDPLSNVKVRQAIAYAIDRDQICQAGEFGLCKVIQGPTGPGSPWYFDYAPYSHDVAKAKELLTEAGFPNGFSITLMPTSTYENTVRQAQVVQQNLADVGITATINSPEWSQWLELEGAGNYDAYLCGWLGLTDADSYYYLQQHTGEVFNFTGYSNPDLDKLLEQGRSSSDFDKRFAIYQQANKLLVDDAPYVYFYTPLSLRAWKPYVQGFVNRPDQLNALWTTWLDK
jgi:peptide/nickel transport system substrate-binding protein